MKENNNNPVSSSNQNPVLSALLGVAVSDALGVPVEFMSRGELNQNPVTDMRGFGTYNQPAGTWSDDTSMTLCLADALTKDFRLDNIANNFIKWLYEGYWTARGEVFDVGIGTRKAINRLIKGESPLNSGGNTEYDNGNGSLMRILPLVFHIQDMPIEQRFELTRQVSGITHGHIRSVIACFYYLEFAREILAGKSLFSIYKELQESVPQFLRSISVPEDEIAQYSRIFDDDISQLPEEKIKSTGYVVDSLEASIWCLLTCHSYKDTVLRAVNLGGDTDTITAITGGLAGLYYGYQQIPSEWIAVTARIGDIEELANLILLGESQAR